jgi:hypothetical protein
MSARRSALSHARWLPRVSLAAFGLALVALALTGGPLAGVARAQEWRLEQPPPPPRVPGEPSATPIGLGKVGDIEFWAPNRGLLITDGNGHTIPAGIWAYNGETWHELTTVCGATEGRIAWAGPDDFWTISDGRPGQASNPQSGEVAPIKDNTLCHFSGGQVVASYGSLAFQANSYQPMHAAGCYGPANCWFAGDPLPEPQVGAFHLHWNGSTLVAEPNPQGHATKDMSLYDGHLFESVALAAGDQLSESESAEHPSILHEIAPEGVQPTFLSLLPQSPLTHATLPEYASGEFPDALEHLHLSADDEAIWAAAGPVLQTPAGSHEAAVTVLRYSEDEETQQLVGSEIIGPDTTPSGSDLFPNERVRSVAAEPGTDSAWVAMRPVSEGAQPNPNAKALLAHVSADGAVSTEELPSGTGTGKGGAERVVCPASEDCWAVTTGGWLFHLSDGNQLPRDEDPAFTGLITYRPPDEGVPQVPPDAPPEDDSGVVEATPNYGSVLSEAGESGQESKVKVPLLSGVQTRIVHGSTLELRFRLAVKARVRLLAERRSRVVARTAMHTFAAGNRKLQLRLSRRSWPTKLNLQTHALAPLPTVSVKAGPSNSNSLSTGFTVLPHVPSLTGLERAG